MDKHTFLQSVREAARESLVTESEVLRAFREGYTVDSETERTRVSVSQILSYLGGAIVAIGAGIFVEQNWDLLGSVAKILATLGVGVIAFYTGTIFIRTKERERLGWAAHLIALITLTIGLFVTLDIFQQDISQSSIQSLVFAFLLGVYAAVYGWLKHPLLALGSVLFGSALFVTLTSWMEEGLFLENFGAYQFFVLGLTWILLGFAWVSRRESVLTPFLYFFGLPTVFIQMLTLGGDPPSENWFWMIVLPAAALGATFWSPWIKSRLFLIWGAFFLVVDIFKITNDYFSEGFGWPLALVVAGLALMVVGTLVVRVNKQYALSAEAK